MDGTVLRLEQVAEKTRVPLNTLRYWRYRDQGEGPPTFKLGRHVVAYEYEVDAWIRANREAAAG